MNEPKSTVLFSHWCFRNRSEKHTHTHLTPLPSLPQRWSDINSTPLLLQKSPPHLSVPSCSSNLSPILLSQPVPLHTAQIPDSGRKRLLPRLCLITSSAKCQACPSLSKRSSTPAASWEGLWMCTSMFDYEAMCVCACMCCKQTRINRKKLWQNVSTSPPQDK